MADEASTSSNNDKKSTDKVESKVEQPQQPTPTTPTNAVKDIANKAAAKGINKTVVIAVVAVLIVAGSLYYKNSNDKKNTEKAAENLIENLTGDKVKIDADNQSFKYEDKDTGESVTIESGQKLPSDFPKDSIVYLDEKSVTAVITSNNDGKKTWSVTTAVSESVEKAAAYFEEKLVEPDYTDISSYGYNDSKTFAAKSEKYNIFVTISKYDSDADTSITYVIEEEK